MRRLLSIACLLAIGCSGPVWVKPTPAGARMRVTNNQEIIRGCEFRGNVIGSGFWGPDEAIAIVSPGWFGGFPARLIRGGTTAVTEKERFELARELIRHEDGLVNHRITWLLVLQGLLFAAFSNGAAAYAGTTPRSLAMGLGLVVLVLLGIGSALTAPNVVKSAYRQIGLVKKWWGTGHNEFPSIAGERGQGLFRRVFSTSSMPMMIVGVWSVMLALLVVDLVRSAP